MSLRNASCVCGSGKRYKHCCGRINTSEAYSGSPSFAETPEYTEGGWFQKHLRGEVMARFCPHPPGRSLRPNVKAPPGILVVPNFLGSEKCVAWCQHLRLQNHMNLKVQDEDAYLSNKKVTYEIHTGRVTQAVDYSGKKKEIVQEVSRSFSECVMPFFNVQLAAFEPPTVLRYEAGGKYDAHSDNELWNAEQRVWLRTMNRDYSILIYLNEDFEGGKLSFPNFQCKITPETGMLVAFPSDHRYLHAAEPIVSGERYAVVSWAAREKHSEPDNHS